MAAFIYRQDEPERWTVGYYSYGRYNKESEHKTGDEAAARCHWLNGGGLAEELRQTNALALELVHRADLLDKYLLKDHNGGTGDPIGEIIRMRAQIQRNAEALARLVSNGT